MLTGISSRTVPPFLPSQPSPGTKVVIPFLTHFADLSSWEYAQKLIKVLPTLEASGVQVFAVGLGSAENAQVGVTQVWDVWAGSKRLLTLLWQQMGILCGLGGT